MTNKLIQFPKKDQDQWKAYMDEFSKKVWPMFAGLGFSFQEAYQAWRFEQLITCIEALENALIRRNPD